MKNLKHKITAIVVCAVLVVSAFIVPTVINAGATEWDFEREGYANAFDYLMARDGYVYGMDYDWADVVANGPNVLSKNNLTGKPATYNHYRVYIDLYNMYAMGFNAVNYWMFNAGQGLIYNSDGLITGVEQEFFDNTRDMLDICREVGIKMVPSILPHTLADSSDGMQETSHTWNKFWRFIWDDEAQQAYFDNAFDPLMRLYAEYQDVVICMGLTVENGNGYVNDPDMGYVVSTGSGTSWKNYAAWVNAMHDHVKAILPNMPTECEEVGGDDKVVRMSRDTKVDLVGQNYYHSTGGVNSRRDHYTTRTGLIGEYNNGEDGVTDFTTYYWGQYKKKFIENSMKNGWLGAFYFSYCTGGNPFSMTSSNNSFDYESFYKWSYEFRYVIDNCMNKYYGVNPAINKAHLLANKGLNTVYWIAPEGAVKFKLERSKDAGKTFTTVNSNILASNSTIENGLIKYTDNGISHGDSFCYRVTSYNSSGASSVSPIGNVEKYFEREELVVNGGFESGYDNWTGSGIVNTEQKVSGTHSAKLVADADNGAYSFMKQEITVKPHTLYKLKYYYKIITDQPLDENNVEGDFVRVHSSEGSYLTDYNWGEEVGNGWYVNEVPFSTGNVTKVTLEINVGAKKNFLGYYDDFSIEESR